VSVITFRALAIVVEPWAVVYLAAEQLVVEQPAVEQLAVMWLVVEQLAVVWLAVQQSVVVCLAAEQSAAEQSALEQLAAERGVGRIVLGRPLNMDGTAGERVEKCEAFKVMLERRTGLPVDWQDERLTTVAADEILEETGVRKQDRKKVIDQVIDAFEFLFSKILYGIYRKRFKLFFHIYDNSLFYLARPPRLLCFCCD
jgi:putative transcription antitermination factor YqgF